PLLYQVATAALSPGEIAMPIRRVFRHARNIDVVLGEVMSIDTARKAVVLRDGEVPYDRLVVATGATHAYFGHDEWERHAPGLKSLEDALEIRRRVLLAYEAADREPDPELRKAWMTFVVVGAGATGVELAGALTEIARNVLRRDFRHIDPASARVLLVEAGPRVLSAFSEPLSADAAKRLAKMGVELSFGVPVTAIDAEGVTLGASKIRARTVVWAAGVAASPLAKTLGVPLDRAGRVAVEKDLSITGHSDVFVIGDLAAVKWGDKLVPGVAPAAIQGGRFVARQLLREAKGQPREEFRYFDKGSMATIGRAAAVAETKGIRLTGFIAWLAWLFVHIMYLIGFRNRVAVVAEWAWMYARWERGARLITGEVRELVEPKGDASKPRS
ncbi:MAG: NAD(P)/FAD-dependent oxidoreductase, partial [Deltaproteobacteria bacterium]|nr:NAD(P)/FAD-dependent oxidoreductase [Deltaproteobacteria bacterium]